MKNLSIAIPPFAPDYSGACSAMFSLNGQLVIHDASGCTGNYTTFDEPRWYGSAKPIYCSGLRKMDAVFGNEDAFIERVLLAVRERPVEFIAIVGSPVPMVIGTDFEGLAKEIEEKSGIPAVGLATNGTQYYNRGVAMAACAMIDRFSLDVRQRSANTVNIVGATPLDISAENTCEMRRFLCENGWKVQCLCASEWTLEELRHIGAAQVNVAVSQAGREIAEHLNARFGTPWLADLPIGEMGARMFLQNLDKTASGEAIPNREDFDPSSRVVVLEDWVAACAICRALRMDLGVAARPVGLFGRVGLPQDVQVAEDEAQIEAQLRGASAVVSDPVLFSLAEPEAIRVSIPKYAVSSKLVRSELYIHKSFIDRAAKLAVQERKV